MDERKKKTIKLQSCVEVEEVDGYSKDVFCYILRETQFEKYASELFDELLNVKLSDDLFVKEEDDLQLKGKLLSLEKEVAEVLLMCKTNQFKGIYSENGEVELSFKGREIKEVIEKEYVKLWSAFFPMTIEEGREALKRKYEKEREVFIAKHGEELGFSKEDINAGVDWDSVEMDDDEVQKYIDEGVIEAEITPQKISDKLSEINETIARKDVKRGAPRKNLRLHCAIAFFMKTGKYTPNAETYRLIYRCLDYLGMIDDRLKSEWAKKNSPNPEVSYIKSLCKEASKYRVFYVRSNFMPF